MGRIVIVSNGHGEDIIGARLGLELTRLGYAIAALPLVGRGRAYERAGFVVLGPRREMPSGGFVLGQPTAFWEDLRAGWLSMSLGHYRALRRAARGAMATLVVGDIYGLLVGSLFGIRPLFQMQPLVSVRAWASREGGWAQPYGGLERLLMRRAVRVYPREAEAAGWLQEHGVPNVQYLGNPMLDALEGEEPLPLPPPYLLLLPGSRADAYESLPQMLEACRRLQPTGLTPVVAWAGLPLDPLRLEGWQWGGAGWLTHPDGTRVVWAERAFKTALLGSRVALSTSGTAAEQAAGYGVPIVGFPTGGPQYTLGFAQGQRRLLREALTLTEPRPEAIAQAVRALLEDEGLRRRAQEAGKAAMGEPGAAGRIAQSIHTQLSRFG
ncbi:lipid-A-disaccharide synthase-related protein [Meiothermus granaticius]|uniref:Lipid-A-disaccharide synthase n=1 Tax=Meiothermus granaticius NBRC 107808 TaxID=1227551 RepID=A0A399F539_9DEIN|nr:lipid-A-disaccharide synthase-related protein [Meiothermus granaticius]RIH91183.1 hypothetical protein Mgrana_02911 [Meiothermus granaticius NBRC 107808]GEM87470.1 lipid-A-disaccharide synthase [Meiothermus granaticius NBRC 107808]